MAKSQDRQIKDLKHEVEVLRAQLKSKDNSSSYLEIPEIKSESKNKKYDHYDSLSYNIDALLDTKYIKTQLTKTFILSAFSFISIFSIYFYGIDKLLKFLPTF